MNCIVIDDEPLARQLIESYIEKVDGLQLVRSCTSAVEAFEVVHQSHVDLLFLDIEMPKVSGLDFLRSLRNPPKVILTTAYREFALEAYELDVIDYLLKPVLFERFLKSISKVYEVHAVSKKPTDRLSDTGTAKDEPYLYLKEDREMVKVFLKDILFIESMKDYVKVKTVEGQIVSYQRIGYLEEKLPDDRFIRVHRSFIIAFSWVSSYTMYGVKVGQKEIPIGRNYKQSALKALNKNNVIK